mgnify:CR=1 FL=1
MRCASPQTDDSRPVASPRVSAASRKSGFGQATRRVFKRSRLCSRFQLVAEAARHHMALHAPVNNRLGGAGLAYGLRERVVFG